MLQHTMSRMRRVLKGTNPPGVDDERRKVKDKCIDKK